MRKNFSLSWASWIGPSLTSLTGYFYSTMTCVAAYRGSTILEAESKQEEPLSAQSLTGAQRCTYISLQVPVRRPDDLPIVWPKIKIIEGKWRAGNLMSHFTNRPLHNYREIPVQERLLVLPKPETVWKHTRLALPESKKNSRTLCCGQTCLQWAVPGPSGRYCLRVPNGGLLNPGAGPHKPRHPGSPGSFKIMYKFRIKTEGSFYLQVRSAV